MIRRAHLSDIPLLVEVARAQPAMAKSLRFSDERTRELLTSAVSSAAHYARATETEGRLTGCLVALTYDTLCAERKTAAILLFDAPEIAEQEALLLDFFSWFDDRRILRQIEFVSHNPEVQLTVQKHGMRPTDTVYRKFKQE